MNAFENIFNYFMLLFININKLICSQTIASPHCAEDLDRWVVQRKVVLLATMLDHPLDQDHHPGNDLLHEVGRRHSSILEEAHDPMVARLAPVRTVVLVHAVEETGVLVPCKKVVQMKVPHLALADKEAVNAVAVVVVVAEHCQLPLAVPFSAVALALNLGVVVPWNETCRLPNPDRECPTTPIRALSCPLGIPPEIWEDEV